MHFNRLVILFAISLLFFSQQAFADKMPRHHSGFFSALAKSSLPALKSAEASKKGSIKNNTAKVFEEQKLKSWSSRPTKVKDGAGKLAASLGLDINSTQDWRDLKTFLAESDDKKRKKLIKKILKARGMDHSDKEVDAKLKNFKDTRDEVLNDYNSKYYHEFDKNNQMMSYWDKDKNAYRSVMSNPNDEEPSQLIFYGDVKLKPSKSGNDLEVSVEPSRDNQMMVLDAEEIKKREATIFGEWKESDGRVWRIERAEPDQTLVKGDRYTDMDVVGLFPFSENATPIVVTIIRKDGTEFKMRNAYISGLKIKTDRTLTASAKQDITNLPDWVIDDLVASWFPGEWHDMTIIHAPHPRDTIIDADQWRLHVTYRTGGMFGRGITELHDPYIEEHFPLTRDVSGRYKTADGAGQDQTL